jgi:uncharacterized membrane protein
MDEICKIILKKGEEMAGKISGFLREYISIFSVILIIIGLILFLNGVLGEWAKDFLKSIIRFSDEYLAWSLYLVIIGFIVLITGIWYLYSFLKNRKFVLEQVKTNKRSEFLKKHIELKNKVRHLPSKYQKMVKEKEEELKIK